MELKLPKILRFLIYCSAIVPLIIFSQYISPFHFGKVLVFRTLVEVMTILYVLLAMQDRHYLPKKNNILLAFLGFTFVFLLATIFSVDRYQSFWGTLERMGGWWSFLHY